MIEDADLYDFAKQALAGSSVLLPLPPLPPPPRPFSRSARCRGRYRRALALWSVAERTRAVLNETGASEMGGTPARVKPCRLAHAAMSTEREAAWRHILRECQRVERARRESLAGALTGVTLQKELLKRDGVDCYGRAVRAPTYLPFEAGLMAEPPAHHGIDMLTALPPHLAVKYAHPDLLIKPPAEWPEDFA